MIIDPKTFTFGALDRMYLTRALKIAIREERIHKNRLSKPEHIEHCEDNIAGFEELLERLI